MITLDELQSHITLLNEGSDNEEYLRGQVELAMMILGITYDDTDIINKLTEGYFD